MPLGFPSLEIGKGLTVQINFCLSIILKLVTVTNHFFQIKLKNYMKILITGATGFVGKMLLPLLVEKGHDIIVLTRDILSASVRLPVAFKIIE